MPILRRVFSPLIVLGALASYMAGACAGQQGGSAQIGQDPMAQRYELGHGLKMGESGFRLGGYGEAIYSDFNDDDPRFSIDALSMLLWWDSGGPWHFFAETELQRALVLSSGDSGTDQIRVVSERLYVDYIRTDTVKLRLGKFLTPVGRWNLIHAAPLTWTTSRPLITEATFPTNATGAMIYGVLPWTDWGIEYSLYASPGEEVFPEPGLDTFREAFGGRVSASVLPDLQIGVSYVSFEQESSPDQRKHLLGADFSWRWRRAELSAEYAFRAVQQNAETRDEDGFYVQLVVPLGHKLFAVSRYEQFHATKPSRDLQLYLGGLSYRYHPALSFKIEYSRSTDDDFDLPDGLLGSIAVLF